MGTYFPDKDEWDDLNGKVDDLGEKLDTLLDHFNLNEEDQEESEETESSEESEGSEESEAVVEGESE